MSDDVRAVLETGNLQMDQILHGGFPANSINIIMGQPGTGKTVFAEQMVFHHARTNSRPILYLTTLSEPLSKVLTYLQRFSFYEEDKIGSLVQYCDIGFDIANKGIGVLKTLLEEKIHSVEPKIIVIDSFKALHDIAESKQQLRRTLYELTGLLSAYNTTVFLVGEYTEEHGKTLPEFAIADGIMQLLRNPLSTRDERFLRVLKLRGSSYTEGLHGFKITSSGLSIYPRLVSPNLPEDYQATTTRIKSGIEGLDEMVGGGIRSGSRTLVAGPTGSGKTTFALQFVVEGVKNNEPSLYINFQENPPQLARAVEFLGNEMRTMQDAGLELLYASPVELQIDSIIATVFNTIETKKIKRVVVDSLGDLAEAASDKDRLHNYLYALGQHFIAKGVTALFLYEADSSTPPGDNATMLQRFSNMADNIVKLSLPEAPDYKRTIRCLKARGSEHEERPRAFKITKSGLKIFPIDGAS